MTREDLMDDIEQALRESMNSMSTQEIHVALGSRVEQSARSFRRVALACGALRREGRIFLVWPRREPHDRNRRWTDNPF